MAAGTWRLAAVAALLAQMALVSPGQAQLHDLIDIPPPPQTDAVVEAAFQCPESLAGDDQRRQALVDYFHWTQARHPDWSVADAVEFRKHLMIRHQCTASLRDMADFAKHEQK